MQDGFDSFVFLSFGPHFMLYFFLSGTLGWGERCGSLGIITSGHFSRKGAGLELKVNRTGKSEGKMSKYPVQETH